MVASENTMQSDVTPEAAASDVLLSPVDAVVNVSIKDMGLEALITIEPPIDGGAAPTLEQLHRALAEQGVIFNIDQDHLEALVTHPIYNVPVSVARGIAPVDGKNGTASFCFETDKSDLKPREYENGMVDYRDLGLVENVTKGHILCVITHPTEGTPGKTVTGRPIPQKRGKPVPNYVGKNVELINDGSVIVSKIDGQADFIGRKINVSETFVIKENVDHTTGDIRVAGNLIVRGMVKPGFKIEAGNNIDVSGMVESASVKAGGSVKLLGGVTGSEVYCEGDLKSRFIENSNVTAKGEIRASYVLNSEINCGKSLITEGAISKIIGGKCLVRQNVEAKGIGSAASVKTRLVLGADPTLLHRQQELKLLLPELEKKLESLKPLLTLLRTRDSSNSLTADKQELFQNISSNYGSCIRALAEARAEMEEISNVIRSVERCRVICKGTIFPGVKVSIGSATLVIADPIQYSSLYYEDGDIRIGSSR